MSPVLVIGCGTPLRADDGVAWHVLESLQNSADSTGLVLQAVHQLTPELAEGISKAGTVIFVDAAQGPAGQVVVKPVDNAASAPAPFSHSLTPAGLLSLSRQLYGQAPAKAFLVSVGGCSFELAEDLSEPVAHSVANAVNAIRAIISRTAMNKL